MDVLFKSATLLPSEMRRLGEGDCWAYWIRRHGIHWSMVWWHCSMSGWDVSFKNTWRPKWLTN